MMEGESWRDALEKLLSDLKSKNRSVQLEAAANLRNYITSQSRVMSGEAFNKFVEEFQGLVMDLVSSTVISDKIGGIYAIRELIDIEYADDATKITRLVNSLRIGLQSNDAVVMEMASKALGRLAQASGTLTAEIVEHEVKRALEWLQESSPAKRHAAVLVLKELGTNAPTLFYVHIASFFDVIWDAIHDASVSIREEAVQALRAALLLISERDSRWRLQWYHKTFEEAMKGIKSSSAASIHGSLITIGELLTNTGDFMQTRFREVCDTVLRYRESKDKLVKRTVIVLLPRLALFNPDLFVKKDLGAAMSHLISALKKERAEERSAAFLALGEMALAVQGQIKPYLDNIIKIIKAALSPKSKSYCGEALTCISMLSAGVGPSMQSHVHSLLDLMFTPGLNATLTDALKAVSEHIPSLLPTIQDKLLDHLSMVLANKPFTYPGKHRAQVVALTGAREVGGLLGQYEGKERGPDIIQLALKTLGSFSFKQHILTDFVRDTVVGYLDDDNSQTRREAALTCSSLLIPENELAPTRGHLASVIGEVLEKLLIAGIADTDSRIRQAVLASLDWRFDHHLAQAENLRSLFIALNDEVFEIRELAITIIGRLTVRNPAYVMPSLRKTLIQLLTELEFSGDSRNKEESAKLLGQLIKASQTLIKPYVEPILNALLPKLTDSSPRVTSCVLSALGELSLVASVGMVPHVEALLPLIIDTLQDQSSTVKREVALRTLGQLAESTGYVVEPFIKHPRLLDILLSSIKSEQAPSIRREVVKVLGILGALDPYRHKVNQLSEARKKRETDASPTPDVLAGMTPSSDYYYATVAVTALLTILRNNTLAQHHRDVIQAIMFIFKTLGLKCIPYLPQIMPAYLNVMRTCEPLFRQFLFQQLGELVRIVKQHIRDYLEEIFQLIKQYWPTNLLNQIINLVEEISVALNDEFNVYLPELIPSMLKVLHSYHAAGRDDSIGRVLHALEVFGTNLDDYLHLIIPAIVKLFEQVDVSIKVRILSIQTLGRLSEKLTFSDYASRIIHPLARVLDHASVGTELQREGMATLCSLVYQLGSDYAIFVPMVDKVLTKNRIHNPTYDSLVSRVLTNQPLLPQHLMGDEAGRASRDSRGSSGGAPEPELSRSGLNVDVRQLKIAWEASQRSTKGDWEEWIRRFSVVLLRQSPSPALRSCLSLAQIYHPLAKELFNASFVSCWGELQEAYQELLVQSLETALRAENIPPEILQTLLNLAEFMEHDEKPLPIDIRTLGALAEKCAAYAKALHYKETEFQSSPTSTVEALISINNQLGQPDAAVGILLHAQRHHDIELKESWYEKLHRWDAALDVYRKKQMEQPLSTPLTRGRMRCLAALGEWEGLADLAIKTWRTADAGVRSQIAPLAAAAAWNLGEWDQLRKYNGAMSEKTIDGTFFRAILSLHDDNYEDGQLYIDESRRLLDNELRALVGESYDRAYKKLVRVQQLSEMEEIISYKLSDEARREQLRSIWTKRLSHCQRSLEVWQDVLAVRKLVLPPIEDMDNWLKFAAICRKNNRSRLAHKTLVDLLGENPSETGRLPTRHPKVTFAYIKHLWATAELGTPDKRKPAQRVAFNQLKEYVKSIRGNGALLARCHLKLGQWHTALNNGAYDERSIPSILAAYQAATVHDETWHKAWHTWAIANYEVVAHYERVGLQHRCAPHLVPALQGFFRYIVLSPAQNLQGVLRLLTIWFQYGGQKPVEEALREGFNVVSIDTWLQVIPQLIARIHSKFPGVRRLIYELLIRVGQRHPQALVYPLSVATKSQSEQRVEAAERILDDMRKHSAVLVEQALLVSQELIRIAILWHEQWYEGMEEASRHYFTHHNPEGMLATLEPLHAMLEQGATTLREVAFEQAFGRDLQEAREWCQKYTRSSKVADLNQAWDLYYHVFRRIKKQLPHMTTLELQYVSPQLLAARDLELAVPGTYDANAQVVRIGGFAPSLSVFPSKQRPRKLVMSGSNGKDYEFLLKGHEDLRQDERVMQLFGLINTLLATDAETANRHLKIQQYAIIPLSPNSGLIGWVPNHDTLHALIRDFRESRMLVLNKEHRLMMGMAGAGPDMYDKLTLMQKVEVFEHALDCTPGNDLDRVLWLKSPNSEVWLERRTNYTRSLAVMSMVGYILGLGDRHPSNIMLDRQTGKVTHIDFGDCFEVAVHREKYPENIPFRLTRMLIKAMEVSGIEGNFRFTCESTMRVLREHKESVMAVLEAFVHDPLINWRLLTPNAPSDSAVGGEGDGAAENLLAKEAAGEGSPGVGGPGDDRTGSDPGGSGLFGQSVSSRATKLKGKERRAAATLEDELQSTAPEILNGKALSVVERVEDKLRGRDFNNEEPLDVPAQVQKLIDQATSHENLCQCYIGWCPFW